MIEFSRAKRILLPALTSAMHALQLIDRIPSSGEDLVGARAAIANAITLDVNTRLTFILKNQSNDPQTRAFVQNLFNEVMYEIGSTAQPPLYMDFRPICDETNNWAVRQAEGRVYVNLFVQLPHSISYFDFEFTNWLTDDEVAREQERLAA